MLRQFSLSFTSRLLEKIKEIHRAWEKSNRRVPSPKRSCAFHAILCPEKSLCSLCSLWFKKNLCALCASVVNPPRAPTSKKLSVLGGQIPPRLCGEKSPSLFMGEWFGVGAHATI